MCLIAAGRDSEGLSVLHHLVNRHNDVQAASMLAKYIASGGALDGKTVDDNKVDEGIEAYNRVLLFINSDPSYPFNGNALTEKAVQTELSAHYSVTSMLATKFIFGVNGSENRYLLKSPSYKGSRSLKTHPKHSPHTLNSLQRVIDSANRCLALPKKRHFFPDDYRQTRAFCQVFKDVAIALLPLEKERLALLATEKCKEDIMKCRHGEVMEEMAKIVNQSHSDIKAIRGT